MSQLVLRDVDPRIKSQHFHSLRLIFSFLYMCNYHYRSTRGVKLHTFLLVTSAKAVNVLPGVCLSVFLSVSLSALFAASRKTTYRTGA